MNFAGDARVWQNLHMRSKAALPTISLTSSREHPLRRMARCAADARRRSLIGTLASGSTAPKRKPLRLREGVAFFKGILVFRRQAVVSGMRSSGQCDTATCGRTAKRPPCAARIRAASGFLKSRRAMVSGLGALRGTPPYAIRTAERPAVCSSGASELFRKSTREMPAGSRSFAQSSSAITGRTAKRPPRAAQAAWHERDFSAQVQATRSREGFCPPFCCMKRAF